MPPRPQPTYGLTPQDLRTLRALKTPARIQRFIDAIEYQYADTAWSPARVLRQRKGHCLEGALLAAAAMGERLDKRLWTGAALATGARGNTTSLVGTPEQVAEALCDYYDLGVTTFLIRGFDPLEDNIDYGRHLLPLTKKLIAERDASRAAAE